MKPLFILWFLYVVYHRADKFLERNIILCEEVQQQKYNDKHTSVMYVAGLRTHRDKWEGTRFWSCSV